MGPFTDHYACGLTGVTLVASVIQERNAFDGVVKPCDGQGPQLAGISGSRRLFEWQPHRQGTTTEHGAHAARAPPANGKGPKGAGAR